MVYSRRDLFRTGASLSISAIGLSTFISSGTAFAFQAQAQPRTQARVGFLGVGTRDATPGVDVFEAELNRLLRAEGKELILESRFGQGDAAIINRQLEELMALRSDVLVIAGAVPAAAAKTMTGSIPILFTGVSDPVGLGLVASLVRPGGNLTGIYPRGDVPAATSALQLLKEIMPAVTRVGYMRWDSDPSGVLPQLQQHEAAAGPLGITLTPYPLKSASDLDPALTHMIETGQQALRVPGDGLTQQLEGRLETFSLQNRIPVIWNGAHRWTLAGYTSDTDEPYRRLAMLADLVQAGANPGELPLQQLQADNVLVVNKASAEAMGVVIPAAVLARATEIIS
jgi:putative ABC transport system substrate-binding protein